MGAFNEDLAGDDAGKSLRPLGSMLMPEIAKLLDGSLQSIKPAQMLETRVFKLEFAFDGRGLQDGKDTSKENDLLFHQRIVSAG